MIRLTTESRQPANDSSPRAQSQLATKDLTTSEMLVVWATRYWVHCFKGKTDPGPLLNEGFAAANAFGAVAALDQILTLTLSGAKSSRDVRCIGCKGVGDGERDILDAVALAQMNRIIELGCALDTWLHPTAARHAMGLFHDLGTVLKDAELVVFPRDAQSLLRGHSRVVVEPNYSAVH